MTKTKTDKIRGSNLGITESEYVRLSEQVTNEISVCYSFMLPKWDIWQKRLKIFNNQKKDNTAVSDPMVFTHFQTILAALYDDKLKVGFVPRTKKDIQRAENLDMLYSHDAVDMEKAIIDYKWMWHTLFTGRGLVVLSQWDSGLLCPVPEVVNMLTWHRDPNATSVNGDSKGRGAMRFGGRPILMTMEDLQKAKIYKNLDELSEKTDSIAEETQREVDEAQGVTKQGDVSGDNKNYTIMEWWTKFEMEDENKNRVTKRVLVGIQDSLVVRFTILKDQEEWGIIDKSIYPDALSWDGVSVVDLLEDKQRANARILNAAIFNVESGVRQMMLYDSTKIRKSSHLNFGFNKRIPIAGDVSGAVQPVPHAQVGQEVGYIMETLKGLGERATGATELQQGAIAGSRRTATEIATVQEGADTRFSLSAKIFGWSEKAFARYWYKMYKMYYTGKIHEKVMRLNGLVGYFWKPLKRDDIIGEADPEIKVESKIVSEARRLRGLQMFTNAYPLLTNSQNKNQEILIRERARLNE